MGQLLAETDGALINTMAMMFFKNIAAELDAFNAINRAEAAQSGARYVDTTAVSREAAGDAGLTAGDGLHPSGRLYAAWAELALPEAIAALRS